MAITKTFAPTADSTVRQPNLGNGRATTLQVGLHSGSVDRALVRFALPDWSALRVTRVVSAYFRFRNSNPGTIRGGSPRVTIHRATAAWSEGGYTAFSSGNGVIWTSQPSSTSAVVTSATLSTTDDAWNSIDATAIVRAWAPRSVQSGLAAPNYGIVIRSFDEGSTARTTEFYAREFSGADPQLVIVLETDTLPLAPSPISPRTADDGGPGIAYVTVVTGHITIRVSAHQLDPDPGDYLTGFQVQVFAGTAIDAATGASLVDVTYTYAADGSRQDASEAIDVTDLVMGTHYRIRFRTRDRALAWGAWSSLDDAGLFLLDVKPVAGNPAVDATSARPTFSVSLSGRAGAEIAAMYVRVFQDTTAGTITMWDSGWQDTGAGGTRGTASYGGSQDLAFGTKYRWEVAVRDDLGGESAFLTGLTFTPKEVTGPDAMSPIDVETKQDTNTPTLTIGNSSDFDAYELEVAEFSDGTGSLWDVGVTAVASTSSVGVVYAGTILTWGRTYYWRAKIRVGGTTWSDWSPWYPFYVNALPSKPRVSIDDSVDSGVGAYGAYRTVPTAEPVYRLPFVDLDLVRGYLDVPTRREIQIIEASSGADVTGSPFVITTAIGDTFSPDPGVLTLEETYRIRVRFDDSAGQRSEWSDYLTHKVSDPPVVASGDAVDVDDPTARLDWTFTSGKVQRAYRVRVFATADAALAYDSGTVLSAETEAIVPGYILADATEYSWALEAWDSDNLSAAIADVETWTTAFVVPDPLTGDVTVTSDSGTAALVLDWTASDIEARLFWRYFVDRLDPATAEWIRIGEVDDRDTPTFTDVEAPIGVESSYQVTVSNGWEEGDPPIRGTGTLVLIHWWIVTPDDPTLTFEVLYVEGFRDSVDPQQEAQVPLGRSAPVVVSGEQLAPAGSFSVRVMYDNGGILPLLLRAARVNPYVILKSPLGDVYRVKLGQVDRERAMAGVQSLTVAFRAVA